MRYFMYYQVKDVMTTEPTTVEPDMTLSDVEAIFEEHGFDGLPVVDENKRLLGVITKLDLLKACAFGKTDWFPALARQKTSDVMAKETESFHPDAPLRQVLQKMGETGRKSVPVVKENRLIGIIAQEDILIALRKASLGVIPARLLSPDLEGLIEPTNLTEKH
jgi:CBS domain-containing protein